MHDMATNETRKLPHSHVITEHGLGYCAKCATTIRKIGHVTREMTVDKYSVQTSRPSVWCATCCPVCRLASEEIGGAS